MKTIKVWLYDLIDVFFKKLIKSLRTHAEKIADHDYAMNDIRESIMFLNAKLLDFGGTSDQKSILRRHEFKVYSQNGEDGILLYIFSTIGIHNRTFVDFGAEDGRECNTANLSLNWGWSGLLIEASTELFVEAKKYYRRYSQVTIVNSYVTPQNINQLLIENKCSGEIDLLSIDIDSNDYWVWESIHNCNPRVVVIEYNANLGSDKSITVKYDAIFNRLENHPSGYYFGASLLCLQKLAQKKGYILIGCDSKGCNAFFVRSDIARPHFVELSAATAYYPLTEGWAKRPTPEEAFQIIKDLEFVEI